jgi:tetratricopeptide (TPR) repeat protein
MTCKKCGAEIAETAKFCPECGAKVEETAAEKELPEKENVKYSENPEVQSILEAVVEKFESLEIMSKNAPELLKKVKRVLSIEPDNDLALGLLGFLYYEIQQYDEALAAFNNHIDSNSNSIDGRNYQMRGECYHRLANKNTERYGVYDPVSRILFGKMFADFDRAIELSPELQEKIEKDRYPSGIDNAKQGFASRVDQCISNICVEKDCGKCGAGSCDEFFKNVIAGKMDLNACRFCSFYEFSKSLYTGWPFRWRFFGSIKGLDAAKRENAITYTKINRNEEKILVLVDFAYWESGKCGIILTTWGMRCYTNDAGNRIKKPFSYSWRELAAYKITVNNTTLLLQRPHAVPIEHYIASGSDIVAYIQPVTLQKLLEKGVELFNNPDSAVQTSLINDESFKPFERRQILVVSQDDHCDIAGVPKYTVEKARELFTFPPNHPVAGTAYSMVDVVPNEYFPLARFHEYLKNSKQAAFFDLCASLGAKEIRIRSVTIDNKALDMHADISAPLAEAGFNLSIGENSKDGAKIAMTFGEGNKQVRDFDSPWINTEPTWKSMIKGRKEHSLETFAAEFNHTDDIGVNAGLMAKYKGAGINIGGSFTEMKRVKLNYEVVFW